MGGAPMGADAPCLPLQAPAPSTRRCRSPSLREKAPTAWASSTERRSARCGCSSKRWGVGRAHGPRCPRSRTGARQRGMQGAWSWQRSNLETHARHPAQASLTGRCAVRCMPPALSGVPPRLPFVARRRPAAEPPPSSSWMSWTLWCPPGRHGQAAPTKSMHQVGGLWV